MGSLDVQRLDLRQLDSRPSVRRAIREVVLSTDRFEVSDFLLRLITGDCFSRVYLLERLLHRELLLKCALDIGDRFATFVRSKKSFHRVLLFLWDDHLMR